MNPKLRLLCILFSLLLFGPWYLSAVEVDNLYTGKILVTDKRQKTRIKAHRWAIEQVLAKVTGNRDILKDKAVQREIRLRTANYIKSFTFITDEQDRIFLVDEFDQKKIDKLLRDAGASIWGKRRPNTLVWLVIEEGLQRNLVLLDNHPQLAEMVLQSADDRGLPVELPNGIDPDNPNVYPSDVWARFDHVVDQASRAYEVENYVMARMHYQSASQTGQPSGWLLEYQLMKNLDTLLQGQASGEQFEVIREMSNAIGDYFASQYAIKSEKLGADEIYLSLEGLNNITDLVQAERYLRSLPPVSSVEVYKMTEQLAEIRLGLSGEGLDVIKALALLPEFRRVEDESQQKQMQALTIEEKLEQLTQDYYRQMNTVKSNEQDNAVAQTVATLKLKYEWVGKQ